jgi:hypothetical protein
MRALHPSRAWEVLAASAALCLASAACEPPSAAAQPWVADVSLGQAAHQLRTGPVNTLGGQVGVRLEGPLWLHGAAGLPFDDAGVPWAAAGAGARLRFALLFGAAGADVGAQGFGYSDPLRDVSGSGAVLEFLPLLELSAGPARVEMRSGAVHYTRSDSDTAFSRTAHRSDVRAFVGQGRLSGFAEARVLRAEDGAFPFAGGAVEADVGGAAVWAEAGSWFAEGIRRPSWGAGVRVPVGTTSGVFASVRQDTNDPLFREPPRRSWAVGLSHRLGGARAAAPAASLAPVLAGHRATFRVAGVDARAQPSVAGDFTGWQAVPMRRDGDGWAVTLRVSPGVHRYAFRRADGTWFVPAGTPGRRADGMGGFSAVLVVP